jgi:peptidylprolyl isomerase
MRLPILGLCIGLSLTACKAKESASNNEAPANAAPSAEAVNAAASAQALPQEPPGIPAPPDVAAPPADAEKAASGLASKVLTKGTGTYHPKKQDQVKVHYTGWKKDGTMFDSSVQRGEPASFGLTQVIAGWTEGLQLMVVGEKRRLWIPSEMAYGDPPKRPGAPAGALTFDVELLDVVQAPEPPPVPEDVKEPPKTAKKTASGLAYRVLKPGTGAKPKATDVVMVHYTGWKTDGEMFDSSVTRGQPASFPLNRVIPGWTEGVQLMKVGEKTRFWIPGPLAYGDTPRQPGAPSGMLVFDVELISIQPTPGVAPAASAPAKPAVPAPAKAAVPAPSAK